MLSRARRGSLCIRSSTFTAAILSSAQLHQCQVAPAMQRVCPLCLGYSSHWTLGA